MIYQTKLLKIILIKLVHITITFPSIQGIYKYNSQIVRFGMVFKKGKVYNDIIIPKNDITGILILLSLSIIFFLIFLK